MDFDPKLMATIGTSFITSLAAKGITGPAETINDLWKASFGYPIHYFSEKRKIKYEINLKKFEKELTEKILEIPKENIQEPKESIIGPALEASKYYFDEEEIRNMFANLIASSMNSTYNGLVQHSLVEIIKQLSPYDAKLFDSLEEKFIINEYPSKIRTDSLFYNYNSFENDIELSRGYFYTNEKFNDSGKNYISLSNLKRLGLIDFYEINELLKSNQGYSLGINDSDLTPPSNLYITTHCYITALGAAFKKVCIKDSL